MKHIIKNVLTDNERKKLIKDCQPYLLDGKILNLKFGGNYPGRQTENFIYDIPCFKDPIDKIGREIGRVLEKDLVLKRVWINWTNGELKNIAWHNHPNADISAVYYMTKYTCGTQFEDSFVKAELNSLLVFPSNLLHTAPASSFRYERYDRYTMALDMCYDNG